MGLRTRVMNFGLLSAVLMFCCANASAQSVIPVSTGNADGFDVFVPISRYLGNGDAEKLSAWFSNSVEITILGESNTCSCSQARHILKSFYAAYTPRSFDVTHKASQGNMKYAIGELKAGGETFVVTVFLCMKNNCYDIHQLKIERL